MQKSLKFQPHLAERIRQGKKTSTWRLYDDKDLTVGDVIALYENGKAEPFASAQIIRVVEKALGALEDADWEGHERFSSAEEMYSTYRKYYGDQVNTETVVKIIWFTPNCPKE